jgi:hypothetical protein
MATKRASLLLAVVAALTTAFIAPVTLATPAAGFDTSTTNGVISVVEDHEDGPTVVLEIPDTDEVITLLGVTPNDVPTGRLVRVTGARLVQFVDGGTEQVINVDSVELVGPNMGTGLGGGGPLTPTTHPVTVVRATWTGGPALSTAPALSTITSKVNGAVRSYWLDQTDGAVGFTVAASHDSIVTSTRPCGTGASFSAWMTEIASKTGYTSGTSKHLLVVTPPSTLCQYAGLGTVGSSYLSGGLAHSNGKADADVISHEFGHNISLGHSNLVHCASGVVKTVNSGSCTKNSYYNTYSVMGFSLGSDQMGAISGQHLVKLGVDAPAELTTATTISLYPLAGSTAPRVARFFGSNGDAYYLEYRTATGADTSMTTYGRATGVLVYRDFASSRWAGHETHLLDGNVAENPNGDGQIGDDGKQVLPFNRWVNLGGIGLRVIAQGTTYATVEFNPSYAAATLPPANAANPTFANRLTFAEDGGTSWATMTGSTTTGVTNSLYNKTLKKISYTAGTTAYDGTGFNKTHQWRTQACTEAGCRYGTTLTSTTSVVPITAAWSKGTASDGILSATISGYNSLTMSGWRLFWCNQRLDGASCSPYSATNRGYTDVRTGNATVTVNMIAKTAKIGSTDIWGADPGINAKGDSYTFGVVTFRNGDDQMNRGWTKTTGERVNEGSLSAP